MSEPVELLHVRNVICTVVEAYRPHLCKNGRFVWRKHRYVAGPFYPDSLPAQYLVIQARQGRGIAPHNVSLSEEEVIRYLASLGEPS